MTSRSDGVRGVHIIVTMCDVAGGGERHCDVMHVTSTARLSQEVRDSSCSSWRYSHGVLY